jgi:DNA polymerase-3 subunit gamma/tau
MSYITLYRKYRPQRFSDVLGQPHVVTTLKNALALEKVAHAYLFCGPRGVGKTTVARLLAKTVNCGKLSQTTKKTKNVEPCNKCEACEEITEGRALDLIEIDAASNRGIDEIRDLREKIKFAPSKLKYKVFIVDEVHMLTQEAFNALLKTLEEPPAHAIFILATTEPYKVPATIISRCQRFDFRKLLLADLIPHLKKVSQKEKIKIDDNVLKLIAAEASGSSRDALSLLGQMISLEDEEITFEEAKSILGIADLSYTFEFVDYLILKDLKGAIKLVNKVADLGFDLKQFLKNLLEYFRKILLIKIDLKLASSFGTSLTKEQFKKAVDHAQKIPARDLVSQIKNFTQAKKEIDDSFIPQLPLEIAVVESIVSDEPQKQKSTQGGHQNNGGEREISQKSSKSLRATQALTKKNPAAKIKSQEIENKNLIELNVVQKKWNDFIQKIRLCNFSLSAFLKFCDPIKIKGSRLILLCKYPFYRERLIDFKNKKLVEEAASDFFKNKIFCDFVLYNEIDNSLRKKFEELKNKKQDQQAQAEILVKKALDIFSSNEPNPSL